MKETISKVKRQLSEWEKIIAKEATDKELISKIYKQFMQLNSRKISDTIKKFCSMKETISKVKRQLSEWEEIITIETTDKELIFKIYKQLMQLNTRNIKEIGRAHV